MITNTEIINYVNLLLISEKDDSFFDMYDILVPNYLNTKTYNDRNHFFNIKRKIIEFAIYEDYFKVFPNENLCLTEKGKLAKKKGGHYEYEKFIEEKGSINSSIITNYNIYNSTVDTIFQNSNISKSNLNFSKNIKSKTKPKPFLSRMLKNLPTFMNIIALVEFILEYKILKRLYNILIKVINN